ncbi:MAG: hypothetical protein ABI600_14160 [Luteolibacter sp.]
MASSGPLLALSIPWTFAPPGMGKALYSGGWKLEYPLGEVNISPGFQFPLQLVYLSTRKQEGLFGSQWFCPQLESSILPIGKGYLLWTLPSGGQMALQQDEAHVSEYVCADKAWRAKVTPSKQVLKDAEGWEYEYAKGRLVSVLSPGRRVLEFEWQSNQLLGIQIRDLVSSTRQIVFVALYGENKRLASFKLTGQLHRFAYVKDGTMERLSAWSPPLGETAKFIYQPDGGPLSKVGIGNTENPARVEEFKTVFVNPNPKGTLANEYTARKQAANLWLVKDATGTYSYGLKGTDKKQWEPTAVTLTALSGLVQNSNYAENRGIVTNKQGGTERKNYYFRSPGQKYDGKLRRIEENGAVVQEYRYDRKSGLLTETVDAKGKSTFYDYDPGFHPSRRTEWEPKPIRIRSGTRLKSEIVAEYAYGDNGKLSAAKDGQGNLTRYTYTPRGELASVTNPAGDTVSYTYDNFGRCASVSRAGHKESLEYDESGRVRMQIAADGTKTEIVYDPDGQTQKIVRNGKTIKELVRDEFKRVIGEKDALKRLSRIEHDLRGNLLAQYAPNGSVTRYEYDSLGHRTAQIDGNGHKIIFVYDPAGHLIKQTNALGNSQTWTYDPKTAKLTERTNGEQVIRQTYNKDGQLVSMDYGKREKLDITYDDRGRPVSVTGPDTSVTMTYDAQGRPDATQLSSKERTSSSSATATIPVASAPA